MINERREAQNKMEVVMLEQLVPQDHLLRKIDKYIDFSFIRDLTRDLYCHTNGRPAVDPVVLFKMLFIGYLYGIRSERQLVKDIEVNLAYRWFLGYSITEKIPDSSTISQNRIRRFKDTDIDQLRKLTDDIKSENKKVIMVFASETNDKIMFIVSVSDDLVEQGYHAGKMIKTIASVAGGGGGGKANMAQAGAKDPSKIDEALDIAKTLIWGGYYETRYFNV